MYKKRDLILILCALLASLLLFCLLYPQDSGMAVEVLIDGRVTAVYSLATDRTILLQGVGGENLLVIENGFAKIESADCPDQLCAHMPKISRVGENITCLPHHLVIRVVGKEAGSDVVLHLQTPWEVYP